MRNYYRNCGTYICGLTNTKGAGVVEFKVDTEDFNKINECSWEARQCHKKVYLATRYYDDSCKRHSISMREFLNLPKNITFKNGDTFDFRSSNIVIAK